MSIKFSNNASTLLLEPIVTTDNKLVLVTGTGSKFPSIVDGETFQITVADGSGRFEIMTCFERIDDELLVDRAQEGTLALDFDAGSLVENRVTAEFLNNTTSNIEVLRADVDDIGPATESKLGLIKVGAGLDVQTDGTLSAIVPEIQPTSEIYVSGPEVSGAIPLSIEKPTEDILIPWTITTGNSRKVFRYTFQEDGTISSLSRYRFVMYMDSVETNRDYTFSGIITANIGGQDVLISGNLYTTRFAVTNPRAEIPLENNVLPSNIRRAAGDYVEIELNVTKSGGSPDTAFIRATPLLDSKLVRNGGEIGSNNIIDYNGTDTASQAARNREYETLATTTKYGRARVATPEEVSTGTTGANGPAFVRPEDVHSAALPVGSIYSCAFSDIPAGGYRLDGSTIIGCNAAFPGFYNKVLATSNRCTMEEYATKLAAGDDQCGFFGVDEVTGDIRLPRVTQFIGGVLTMADLGKAELDQGRNVVGSFSAEAGVGFSKDNSPTTGCCTALGGSMRFRAAGVEPGYNSGPMSIDASSNWGTKHTGARFQPANVRFPYIIQVYSSAIPASVAQAAEFVNLLDGKVDNNLTGVLAGAGSNLNAAGIRTVVSAWNSGTSWYRKWSDGWIEQGGRTPNQASTTVNFFIPFVSSFNVSLSTQINAVSTGGATVGATWDFIGLSSMRIGNSPNDGRVTNWYAYGF